MEARPVALPKAVSQVPSSVNSAAISVNCPPSSRKQYSASTSRIASFSSNAVAIFSSRFDLALPVELGIGLSQQIGQTALRDPPVQDARDFDLVAARQRLRQGRIAGAEVALNALADRTGERPGLAFEIDHPQRARLLRFGSEPVSQPAVDCVDAVKRIVEAWIAPVQPVENV